MAEGERTGVQRRATAAMEAESRAWTVQCPHCGFERSVWDTGGIRYKAAGTSRNYVRCPSCGKRGWNRIYWTGDAAGPGVEPASPGFVLRLVVSIVVGVLLATGAIIFAALKLSGQL